MQRFALALLLVLTGAVSGRAAESKDWRKAESRTFVVYSNASERELRSTVTQLEAFRTALAALFPRLSLNDRGRVAVVLFRDQPSFTPFGPRRGGKPVPDVAGYFTRTPRGDMFVLGAFPDGMTLDTAYHEYVHSIVHRNLRNVPAWVSEGIADFYSSFEMDERRGTATIGRIPPWRKTTLHVESLLPLKQVVTPDGAADILTRHRVDVPMFYAESWALVHFLAFSEDGRRAGQLATYLEAVAKGQSPEAAFTSAFGGSYAQIQSQLHSYLMKPLPAVQIDLKKLGVGAVATDLTLARMQVSDAEALQGCLLVQNAATELAAKHLAAALADDETNRDARGCLGDLRLDQGRPADALAILEPLAADPAAPAYVHYTLGRAYNVADRREDALGAFSRATALNPDFEHAWFELSIAALALRRDSQANAAFVQFAARNDDPDALRRRAYAAMELDRPDIAAKDATRYHEQHGFAEDGDFYTVFLGALAMRRLGQTQEADALLAKAAPAVDPKSWTSRVLAFLQGRLDAKAFADAAKDNGQRTEVHTYVGYADLQAGRTAAAREHFTWVKDNGSRNYVEYPLAVAELARLERGKPSSGLHLPVAQAFRPASTADLRSIAIETDRADLSNTRLRS